MTFTSTACFGQQESNGGPFHALRLKLSVTFAAFPSARHLSLNNDAIHWVVVRSSSVALEKSKMARINFSNCEPNTLCVCAVVLFSARLAVPGIGGEVRRGEVRWSASGWAACRIGNVANIICRFVLHINETLYLAKCFSFGRMPVSTTCTAITHPSTFRHPNHGHFALVPVAERASPLELNITILHPSIHFPNKTQPKKPNRVLST